MGPAARSRQGRRSRVRRGHRTRPDNPDRRATSRTQRPRVWTQARSPSQVPTPPPYGQRAPDSTTPDVAGSSAIHFFSPVRQTNVEEWPRSATQRQRRRRQAAITQRRILDGTSSPERPRIPAQSVPNGRSRSADRTHFGRCRTWCSGRLISTAHAWLQSELHPAGVGGEAGRGVERSPVVGCVEQKASKPEILRRRQAPVEHRSADA